MRSGEKLVVTMKIAVTNFGSLQYFGYFDLKFLPLGQNNFE